MPTLHPLQSRNHALSSSYETISPQKFIKAIFGGNTIHLRSSEAISPTGNLTTTTAKSIFDYAYSENIWAVMGIFDPTNNRAAKDSLIQLPAIVIDFDNVSDETTQRLIENANTLPISYIVSTGGGIHLYTHFKSPVPAQYFNLANNLRKKLMQLCEQTLNATADNKVSLTHALRMPGFPVKQKHAADATAQAYTLNKTYTTKQLQHMLAHIEITPTTTTTQKRTRLATTTKDPDQYIKEIQQRMPMYIAYAYINKIKEKLQPGRRNQMFYLLGAITIKAKLLFVKAQSICREIYETYTEEKHTFDIKEAEKALLSGRAYYNITHETLANQLDITSRIKQNKSENIKQLILRAMIHNTINFKITKITDMAKSANCTIPTARKYVYEILEEDKKEDDRFFVYLNKNTIQNHNDQKEAIRQYQRDLSKPIAPKFNPYKKLAQMIVQAVDKTMKKAVTEETKEELLFIKEICKTRIWDALKAMTLSKLKKQLAKQFVKILCTIRDHKNNNEKNCALYEKENSINEFWYSNDEYNRDKSGGEYVNCSCVSKSERDKSDGKKGNDRCYINSKSVGDGILDMADDERAVFFEFIYNKCISGFFSSIFLKVLLMSRQRFSIFRE